MTETPRTDRRRFLTGGAAAAAAAATAAATGGRATASPSPIPPAVPSSVEFRADPSHSTVQGLVDDEALATLTEVASRFLDARPGDEIDAEALADFLASRYSEVTMEDGEPELEYIYIYVDGSWERYCYYPDRICVTHPGIGTMHILIRHFVRLR